MKASNLCTPRTLGEAQFIPSADPIQRFERPVSLRHGLAWLAGVVAIAGLALAAQIH